MEPGSDDIRQFARWCRAHIDLVISDDQVPALLFADGPDFDTATVVEWHLEGRWPPAEELLEHLLPAWAQSTGASQLGVSVPNGGRRTGVSLFVVDEAGHLYECALLDFERFRLRTWKPLALTFDLVDLQATLARNAGWRDFAKWRCRFCQSVCSGEADTVPVPCDFCSSTDVERVTLETPLRDPDPPYGSFLETVLDIIRAS